MILYAHHCQTASLIPPLATVLLAVSIMEYDVMGAEHVCERPMQGEQKAGTRQGEAICFYSNFLARYSQGPMRLTLIPSVGPLPVT